MRKVLVVAIATLLVAAAAWGQGPTDPLLGPHNVGGVGCESCHAPHNALAGPGAYLWGRSIPTRSYTTYITSTGDGGTLSALPASGTGMVGASGTAIGTTTNPGALATVNNLPQAHTILCLSCHDTTFSGMASISTGTAGAGGLGILAGTNYAIGNNGDLSRDHPVDVKYPTTDPTYWGISIALTPTGTGQYTVSFTDSAYAYGHPARLFSTDGASAYIECGSCHNPHAWLSAVAPTPTGNTAVPTAMFLRGQYRDPNDTLAGWTGSGGANPTPAAYTSANYTVDNANFCMSCHSYPSAQFTGSVH